MVGSVIVAMILGISGRLGPRHLPSSVEWRTYKEVPELAAASRQIRDESATTVWKPVRIGAGGWVVGMAFHPKDPNARYARTDVGNAYRWDSHQNEWLPMKVVHADGSGFPASLFSAPGPGGVQSIGVDPGNPKIVYVAAPNLRSHDIGGGSGIGIYRSIDAGRHFTAGDLNVPGDPNDNWRMFGERIRVDPANSAVVYYGSGFAPGASTASGLYRSLDEGMTWRPVSSGGSFPTTANITNVVVDPSSGVVDIGGIKAAKSIWACGGSMENGTYQSNLYRSPDGGKSWTNVSARTALAGKVQDIFLGAQGSVFAIESGSKRLWNYADSTWTTLSVDAGENLNGLAIDPHDPKRLFVVCDDASVTRSTDGGKTWTNLGRLQYGNTLGWLPQVVGNTSAAGYRATGGIAFDPTGTLWVCQGNEGMLSFKPSADNYETAANPPKWLIESRGIEEFVSQDVIVPKGSGDKIYVAVADSTGLVITDADRFSARQIPLQTDLISQGTQVAACPNDPNTVAITTSNVYSNGKNDSGITYNGGETWAKFLGCLKNGSADIQAGSIASSRRGAWTKGSDHIVQLPVNNLVPVYSKDGGKTWAATQSFPTNPDGLSFRNNSGYQGFWIFALKYRGLYADPFVPDHFYLKLVASPAGLYETRDGGVTWQPSPGAGLPSSTHHGQLAVNQAKQNDLWFVDGFEGASEHGLYHSTDGGKAFSKIPGVTHAITLALGAGRAGAGSYAIYFYGQFASDPKWGVFRSEDGGVTWSRISSFPTGIFDQPTCMAASWDTYGKVVVGFSGNSYVYGSISPLH